MSMKAQEDANLQRTPALYSGDFGVSLAGKKTMSMKYTPTDPIFFLRIHSSASEIEG